MSEQSKEAGLHCPKCSKTEWTIDETRRHDGCIRRNRVCRSCGERIITEEVFVRSAPKRFYLKNSDRITTGRDSFENPASSM